MPMPQHGFVRRQTGVAIAFTTSGPGKFSLASIDARQQGHDPLASHYLIVRASPNTIPPLVATTALFPSSQGSAPWTLDLRNIQNPPAPDITSLIPYGIHQPSSICLFDQSPRTNINCTLPAPSHQRLFARALVTQ